MIDPAHDPHAAIIFPSLPAGNLVERNPLPYHEPPYVPKPFLGRSIELQRLVLMLGRRRNKEVRTLAPTLALAQTLTLALALTTRARRGHQSRGASRLAVGENPKVPHGDERYLLPCSAQLNRHSVLTTYH